MRFVYFFYILITIPFHCFSSDVHDIKKCELPGGYDINLISLKTIDGDTPYLIFNNTIVSAFLDQSIYSGDIILSECINHSLIFALDYGPPYMKGCLITGIIDDVSQKNKPKGFCFVEKHIPESIWFNKTHILIVIKNTDNTGEWKGKYIIYDSRDDEAHTFTHLPNKKDYEIYPISPAREK